MGIDLDEMIEKIIDNGNLDDMQTLSELLEDTMEIIKEYDEECYKKYEMDLYKMAYGSNLSKEMAREIVHNMKPQGERWSIEETQNIQEQFGMNDINPIDFYVVMNQGFNDFNNLFKDNIEMYVTYTDDFINDIDGKPHKVFWYFT